MFWYKTSEKQSCQSFPFKILVPFFSFFSHLIPITSGVDREMLQMISCFHFLHSFLHMVFYLETVLGNWNHMLENSLPPLFRPMLILLVYMSCVYFSASHEVKNQIGWSNIAEFSHEPGLI